MLIDPDYKDYIALAAMLVAAIGFAGAAIILPVILGPRRTHSPVKDSAYECGLPARHEATRFSVRFHIVAMLFVVLDVGVVILLTWAACYRDLIRPASGGGMGLPMLVGGLILVAILAVGHVYAWRSGVLDWAPARDRRRQP